LLAEDQFMETGALFVQKPKRVSYCDREREFRGANGANRAPGTIDTATPKQIPGARSHVVLPCWCERDPVDVLGEYGPRSGRLRIDDLADVPHVLNYKAANIAKLDAQRIGLCF
jgi:hypothetical protein